MTLTIDIAAGSAQDQFGNPNAAISGVVVTNNVEASPPPMAGIQVGTSTRVIEVDVQQGTTFNANSPSTWQAAAGTNRLVVATVLFTTGPGSPDAVSVSIGAQAMTQIGGLGTVNNGRPKSAMFYLLDADIPGTAQTVSVQVTNSCRDCSVVLTELQGVNQTTPVGAQVEASNANLFPNIDETLNVQNADSFILSALQLVTNSPNVAVTIGNTTDSGETLTRIPAGDVTDVSIYPGALFYEIATSTGNITHSWTMSPQGKYSTRMAEIREA